jgi:1,4-dihydroxy-6-naphthoate synthase
MKQQLTIGYSPCPNDTFIFYALVHDKVHVPGIEFREQLADVETLNTMALEGSLDITKVSFHALGHLREQYALLRSKGEVTAGLIIHESRFTYPLYRLEKLLDLGAWWEKRSGLPIPLGGILGKRSLGRDILLSIEDGIRDSLQYANAHPDEVLRYCKRHSQEMDETVMKNHIALYVNDFSLDLGQEGLAAVRRLLNEAEAIGIVPRSDKPLLAEE